MMRLGPLFCVKNLLGVLMLLAFVAGCDNSSSVPTASTPPLVLSISSPYRMVEFDADTLLVSDAKTNAVHFVDKTSLEPNETLKITGRPSGVEWYGSLIYVGNLTTGSVEALDGSGVLLFYLGGSRGLFQQVNDLAVDRSAGLVYVLDSRAALIRVYNANDGTATGLVIDGAGSVPGPLLRPTALEVDQVDGRIFVSEYGPDPQIRVFNNDGTPASGVDPILGSTVGFSMPQGIFIDVDQNLFLAEARTGEIRVLDATYSFMKTVGTRGVGEGELYYPLDVFVGSDTKDLFVTDNQNQRIVTYLGGGTIP